MFSYLKNLWNPQEDDNKIYYSPCGKLTLDKHGGTYEGERFTYDSNGEPILCKYRIMQNLIWTLENGDSQTYPPEKTKECINKLIKIYPDTKIILENKKRLYEKEKKIYEDKLKNFIDSMDIQ